MVSLLNPVVLPPVNIGMATRQYHLDLLKERQAGRMQVIERGICLAIL